MADSQPEQWLENMKQDAARSIAIKTAPSAETYQPSLSPEAVNAPRMRLEHRITPGGEWDYIVSPRTNEANEVTGYESYITRSDYVSEEVSNFGLACELRFNEQDPLSRPGQIIMHHQGLDEDNKTQLPPQFAASCELHAAVLAGEQHLHAKLIPALEMEAMLAEPDAELRTGVIIQQYEVGTELFSVGIGARYAEGEISDPYVFVTDGQARYGELGNIMVEQEDLDGTTIENMAIHREGLDAFPDAVRHNIGARAAETLCTLTATRQHLATGKNVEEPGQPLQSWAEREASRANERDKGTGGPTP